MDKLLILSKIQEKLAEEMASHMKGAKLAHAYATDAESKSEDKYDTRGLEASYLAAGQSRLAAEMQQTVAIYNALQLKAFTANDPVALTALIQLECEGKHVLYFLGPKSGGTIVEVEGHEITLITPTSPLGQALMGKQEGDVLTVRNAEGVREYEIAAVW